MDNIYQNIFDDKYINRLEYPRHGSENYKEKRTVYDQETVRLNRLFYEDLCEEFGWSPTSKKVEKIFAKAWEDGHAYGYSEIYSKFCNLADFVNSLEEK